MKTFALDLDNYQKLISNAATIFQYAPPVTRLRGQPWVINGRCCPGGCRVAFGRFVLITCTPGPDSQSAHCASDVPRFSLSSQSVSAAPLCARVPFAVSGVPFELSQHSNNGSREKVLYKDRILHFALSSVQFSFAPFHYACVPLPFSLSLPFSASLHLIYYGYGSAKVLIFHCDYFMIV